MNNPATTRPMPGPATRLVAVAARLATRRVALVAAALVVMAGAAFAYQFGGDTPFAKLSGGDDSATSLGLPVRTEQIGAFPRVAPSFEASADGEAFALSSAASGPMLAAPSSGSGAATYDLVGRQIIRSGSMDLEVESVVGAFERVNAIATAAGGFVADSGFFGRDEQQSAHMTLRIPAERFDAVVSDLRAIAAEVTAISTSSQDVTGEVTDLQSELRNSRAVESQYLMLLERADTIGEILQVQDRLNQTRLRIDRTEGRIQLLERLSSLATLSVSLSPVPVAPAAETDGGSGLLGAAQEAWEASLSTLNAIATVAVVALVYSWWLLPLLAVALLLVRRFAWPSGAVSPPSAAD